MKNIVITALICFATLLFLSCSNKNEYQDHPDGYNTKYYASFDYYYDALGEPKLTNLTIDVKRSLDTLIAIPVKFFSENSQNFDIEVRLYLRNSQGYLQNMGVSVPPNLSFVTPDSLAIPGIDFNVLDATGNILIPIVNDTLVYYSVVFPGAKKEVRELYIKPLDLATVNHLRSAWFTLTINKINSVETEEIFKHTALNNQTHRYSVSAVMNSYYRRVNFKK